MEVLRVVAEMKLAPDTILERGYTLRYDGIDALYSVFVWKEFFEVVWPKVR